MTPAATIALTALILATAMLYSSVGHAGASGYLAAMALFSLPPEIMKPTALALNILVASIATYKFYRAGWFSWSTFWPFALGSVPLAFLGGSLMLPDRLYKSLIGLVLLYAALRIFRSSLRAVNPTLKPLPMGWALAIGVGIGFLSGLTGVGGGIFLSPLLLLAGWTDVRQTSGIAAAFILVNSLAGLTGHLTAVADLPGAVPIWGVAATLGGYIGSEYGSRRLNRTVLRQLLAFVLLIAGGKMIFT